MESFMEALGTRKAKDDLFDRLARVAASLASGRRLEIIDVLAQAPRTVENLAAVIGQSVANTSHHLRRLANDGLVESQRDGRHISYRLASNEVYELWRAVQDVTATHDDGLDETVESYVGDRAEIDLIDQETLWQRLRRGDDLVVIDVRPVEEYQAGHIHGAISVPPANLAELLPELPQGIDIVAYCRGHYCAYADEAVRLLMASGRTAFRLAESYREWAAQGGDRSEPSTLVHR
jgi:DNA-binding transcriptional ArsR family regulator